MDRWEFERIMDFMWREGQIPYRDVWVCHPRDHSVGEWQRVCDYSAWGSVPGSSDVLCALPPRRMSILDLMDCKRL